MTKSLSRPKGTLYTHTDKIQYTDTLHTAANDETNVRRSIFRIGMNLSQFVKVILTQAIVTVPWNVQALSFGRSPILQYKQERTNVIGHLKMKEEFTSEYNEEDLDDFLSSSDEVALLAARAYLQRKHRVKWDQKEARKAKLLNSLALTRNVSSDSDRMSSSFRPATDQNIKQDGIGYFWENPKELRYLRTGRPRLDFESTEMDGLNLEMLEEADHHHDQFHDKVDKLDEDDSDEELSQSDFEDEGIFTSFPQSPPAQHEKQSQARKKLFQDPNFKAKWYKARWGEKASMTVNALQEEKRQKRIEALVESIPSELLASSELNELSDDEIEGAIRTYVRTNQKKSASMKRSYLKKKKLTQLKSQQKESFVFQNKDEKSVVTPFLLNSDANENEINMLLEAKRKRSERARKAYQTRLNKEKLKESVKPSVDSVGLRNQSRVMLSLRANGMSVSIKEAVDRINASIIWGKYPDADDIKTILRPQRLSGRKDLLLEVLNKSLGLRGRCVPVMDGSSKGNLQRFYSNATEEDIENCEKKFATSSSLQELGMFILYKIEK